jgi:hypothetical protein
VNQIFRVEKKLKRSRLNILVVVFLQWFFTRLLLLNRWLAAIVSKIDNLVDRNLLCDGQTIKQGRLCVNSNVGARCGRDRPGNKKRCGEISCVAPGASDNYALCQPAGLFLRVALPFSLDGFFHR